MKFQKLEKVQESKFITRYDLTYETVDHQKKVYEMISRDRNISDFSELVNHDVDAVVLIMHDEKGEKVLLNREYRMAVGRFVYNFPAV